MNGIVFFLEDEHTSPNGLINPQTKIRSLSISSRSFGIDTIFLIDLTKYKIGQYYKHNSESIAYHYYDDFHTFLQDYRDNHFIVLDLKKNIDRSWFVGYNVDEFDGYEENNIFIVGPDGYNIFSQFDFTKLHASWVYIPCQEPNVLYAEHALIVALYNFYKRRGVK